MQSKWIATTCCFEECMHCVSLLVCLAHKLPLKTASWIESFKTLCSRYMMLGEYKSQAWRKGCYQSDPCHKGELCNSMQSLYLQIAKEVSRLHEWEMCPINSGNDMEHVKCSAAYIWGSKSNKHRKGNSTSKAGYITPKALLLSIAISPNSLL